jgi:hypothetical protein
MAKAYLDLGVVIESKKGNIINEAGVKSVWYYFG